MHVDRFADVDRYARAEDARHDTRPRQRMDVRDPPRVEAGGHVLPKGCIAFISPYVLHHQAGSDRVPDAFEHHIRHCEGVRMRP